MELYILRHAIAEPRGLAHYPNDDRPLTQDGIVKMEKAACGIRRLVSSLDVILTSPLRRAHDTAKITATTLHLTSRRVESSTKIKIIKELLPDTSPEILLAAIKKLNSKKNVMIVGHEPDLSSFASFLLGSQTPIIEFKKGALCRIDVIKFPPQGKGTLAWHLTPKQLRLIGKTHNKIAS